MPAQGGVGMGLCRQTIIPVAANHPFAASAADVHDHVAMGTLARQIPEAHDAGDAATLDVVERSLKGGQVPVNIRNECDTFHAGSSAIEWASCHWPSTRLGRRCDEAQCQLSRASASSVSQDACVL